MNHFKSILFPTDFSESSDHARDYAFALAKNSLYTLHAVHALDSFRMFVAEGDMSGASVVQTREDIEGEAQAGLDALVEEAQAQGIDAQSHLLRGRPDIEIIGLAREIDSGLIVIGTHGRSGFNKLVFGSTCEKVVRYADGPVLSVKNPEHEFVKDGKLGDLNRILYPSDLTDLSEAGLELAVALCRECDATLVLMHVFDDQLDFTGFLYSEGQMTFHQARDGAFDKLKEQASRYPDISTEIEVVTGVPYREITKTIESKNVDMTVMATHGRTGIAHALLGSTTEKVVRLASSPVLTVRPYAEAYPLREDPEIQEREDA